MIVVVMGKMLIIYHDRYRVNSSILLVEKTRSHIYTYTNTHIQDACNGREREREDAC